jgi:putrescine aminotransferase
VAAGWLEERIRELGPGKVAAFIGEPIQGAGGVIIPPDTYWPRIKEILAKYDILFVADEVICGFGRTGEWFGSDFYDLKPDMMTIAKGLTSGYIPMGGLIVRDDVVKVLNEGGDFNHGFTYSGHPVAAAVGLENIRILRDEKIIENAHNETAPYLQKRLRELNDHPLVGEVRGIGLLAAIELVPEKPKRSFFARDMDVGTHCRNHCFENGLVMRAIRDTMVLSPPLIVTEKEVDEMIAKAKEAIDQTARDFGKM